MDPLRCRFVKPNGKKCGRPIRGMTGLQELRRLQDHMFRAHGVYLGFERALEVRESWEEPELPGSADHLVPPER